MKIWSEIKIRVEAKIMWTHNFDPVLLAVDSVFKLLNALEPCDILLTNIGKVVDQLKERKLFLAPGATLGFAPDIGHAIQSTIKTCRHELDYPITRGEILMAINGFSKLNRTEGVVLTDIRGVIDLLKSLNCPLTPDAFLPVGFQKDLQTAILAAIRCIDPLRGVQIPIAPMAPSTVFLNPPPPIVPPPPAPPLCQSTL